MRKKNKFLFYYLLLIFPFQVDAKAFCVGAECSMFSETSILGLNMIDPLIEKFYTGDFLSAMSESAIINNINSSMPSSKKLNGKEIGLGYSMTRTQLKTQNLLVEYSELAELPTQGVAFAPVLHFGDNLGSILKSKNSALAKWNLNLHFTQYTFNEIQIPFVQIRNMNVNGRVFNSGLNLRYFPDFPKWNLCNTNIYADGISLGFGLYHTSQDVQFESYDRKSLPFRFSGQSRDWLGTNKINYSSENYTGLVDLRGGLSLGRFFLYSGLGYTLNYGRSSLSFKRIAAISTSILSNDYLSRPTTVFLQLDGKLSKAYPMWFATLGMEVKITNVKILVELLKNDRSESANVGVKYEF